MTKRVFILCVVVFFLACAAPENGLPLSSDLARLFGLKPDRTTAVRAQVTVEKVNIVGNRRIPESDIEVLLSTKVGQPFSADAVDADIRNIYGRGHFADVKSYVEDGPKGGRIVTFEVKEWPLILVIRYEGFKSIDPSKLSKEYRKRRIELAKNAEYNPDAAKRAANTIKQLLAERGHPNAEVTFETEDISHTAVSLTFKVNEGPAATK